MKHIKIARTLLKLTKQERQSIWDSLQHPNKRYFSKIANHQSGAVFGFRHSNIINMGDLRVKHSVIIEKESLTLFLLELSYMPEDEKRIQKLIHENELIEASFQPTSRLAVSQTTDGFRLDVLDEQGNKELVLKVSSEHHGKFNQLLAYLRRVFPNVLEASNKPYHPSFIYTDYANIRPNSEPFITVQVFEEAFDEINDYLKKHEYPITTTFYYVKRGDSLAFYRSQDYRDITSSRKGYSGLSSDHA